MKIELKGITKIYRPSGDAAVPALREVDLSVRSGEVIALMGPSGCGKTTLLSIIGLLARPSGGEYVLDGMAASGFSRRQQARLRGERLGFIFQSYNLVARQRAWRNVVLPLSFNAAHRGTRRPKAMTALEAVNLRHRAHHYPTQMSGGEQQRVAIARALVNEPELIVADEPTGNLDSATGREIMTLMLDVAQQRKATVVMATHDRSVAEHAGRIVEMKDGEIVGNG